MLPFLGVNMLISKENDFYDWAFHTYPDEKLPYFRETTIKEFESKKHILTSSYNDIRQGIPKVLGGLRSWSSFLTDWSFSYASSRNVLMIGDELHFVYLLTEIKPTTIKECDDGIDNDVIKYFLNKDNFISELNTHKFNFVDNIEKAINYEFPESYIKEVKQEIRNLSQAPIVFIGRVQGLKDYKIVENPLLSSFGFDENPDSLEIMTEVQMYLGSLKDEKHQSNFDDITKRDSKGFDKKSFKTRKEKIK